MIIIRMKFNYFLLVKIYLFDLKINKSNGYIVINLNEKHFLIDEINVGE